MKEYTLSEVNEIARKHTDRIMRGIENAIHAQIAAAIVEEQDKVKNLAQPDVSGNEALRVELPKSKCRLCYFIKMDETHKQCRKCGTIELIQAITANGRQYEKCRIKRMKLSI